MKHDLRPEIILTQEQKMIYDVLTRGTDNELFKLTRAKICSSCKNLCTVDYKCIECDCNFQDKLKNIDAKCPKGAW